VSRGPDLDDLGVEKLDRAIDCGVLERSLSELSQGLSGECGLCIRRFSAGGFDDRFGGFDLNPHRLSEEFRADRFE
jgi:hypothetical protein